MLGAATLFAQHGNLRWIDDEKLAQADLRDVDALIMRSQSQLTAEQLTGSRLAFVGTATAGMDHLPVDALTQAGVCVAHAPGCNAHSVADYWLTAMVYLAKTEHIDLRGKILGLIGYGAVGQQVALRAQSLGMKVIINDPPRLAQGLPILGLHQALDALLAQAEVISLHVPKVITGPWPTSHLLHRDNLAGLKPGTILINTARGDVCEPSALLAAKTQGQLAHLILDVWPQEPHIDKTLMQAATLSTPHIAGHSYVGKWQGTWQIYQAFLQWLGQASTDNMPLPQDLYLHLKPIPKDLSLWDGLWPALASVYDIERDHKIMQAWLDLDDVSLAQAFSDYRQHYPVRSELRFSSIPAAGLEFWQQQVLTTAGVHLC